MTSALGVLITESSVDWEGQGHADEYPSSITDIVDQGSLFMSVSTAPVLVPNIVDQGSLFMSVSTAPVLVPNIVGQVPLFRKQEHPPLHS